MQVGLFFQILQNGRCKIEERDSQTLKNSEYKSELKKIKGLDFNYIKLTINKHRKKSNLEAGSLIPK